MRRSTSTPVTRGTTHCATSSRAREHRRSSVARCRLMLVLATALAGVVVAAQGRPAKTLDIYVLDVEGGNATLAVAPTGESLLIDTGNAGAGAVRDASRILEATRDA